MKNLLRYCIFVAFLLTACAREAEPLPQIEENSPIFTIDELKLLSSVGKNTKYDSNEVNRIIESAIGILEQNYATRSACGRTVAEMRPLSVNILAAPTRNGEDGNEITEELFYAVDFSNEEGFAVISADRRIPDDVIIAVGHGGFSDGEIESPGFGLMLEGADELRKRI